MITISLFNFFGAFLKAGNHPVARQQDAFFHAPEVAYLLACNAPIINFRFALYGRAS